jgi:hypothetical protein
MPPAPELAVRRAAQLSPSPEPATVLHTAPRQRSPAHSAERSHDAPAGSLGVHAPALVQ